MASYSVVDPAFNPKPPKSKRQNTTSARTRIIFIYAAFTCLVMTNMLTAVALLMTPELSTLFQKEDNSTLVAYEKRILDLRMEVDRLHSRQYRQTGDLNLQMQELAQKQQFLAEQHSFVRILAEKAEELGLSPELNPDFTTAINEAVFGTLNNDANSTPQTIQIIERDMDRMVSETRLALGAISTAAEQSTSEIVAGLSEIGIRPRLPTEEILAAGGPLLPPEMADGEQSLAEEANKVMLSLQRFGAARTALMKAPVYYPFSARRRISSTFGNRADPFGGQQAFHSGIDFAAPRGTPVLAIGNGEVVFAGRKSGYGNVIEINHDGIISRYAHLSVISVSVGQNIHAGAPIGKVGSTGRSTGPHLHLELRIDDAPKNPMPYLSLASKLGAFLS